jgi:hypothetical protein
MTLYKATWCHNPAGCNLDTHYYMNHKFYNYMVMFNDDS